ncbi:MAG TPA: GMC family oxidoreductase [Anaerolineae bacterium]|nr:GMC family oxidoreductase [Anaerolineae bacterium]
MDDVLIIGTGAAGSVLAGQLAEGGLKVVCLDAGPYWHPEEDWASDEWEMRKLFWDGPRVNASAGENKIGIGASTSGKAVGGGTIHYTMMALRLHPSDFRTRSRDGVGEDWPLSYDDLAPYYDVIERELPVAGPRDWPWEGKGNYPQPEHELDCQAYKFIDGCKKLGIKTAVCPLALITAYYADPWGFNREPCTNRGFCVQGCKPLAKSFTLLNFIPKAEKHGTKIIDNAFVTRILTDKEGKALGAEYYRGKRKERIEAKVVILSAFVIETPRLLLASASQDFPNGLANSSELVGKYLMVHSDHLVYAKFKGSVRPYRNPPITVITQDFYETDPKNDYKRGFSIAPYGARPISFASLAVNSRRDLWGKKLIDFMRDYNYYMRNGIIGEVLPSERNRVELTDEVDERGLAIPIVYFKYGENDRKLIKRGLRLSRDIMEAAGAGEIFDAPVSAHLMGGCRMGNDPKTSVVDSYGRTHDIPNLFIAGTPIFVTSGAVNPTLTAQALAARTAEHIIQTW